MAELPLHRAQPVRVAEVYLTKKLSWTGAYETYKGPELHLPVPYYHLLH